MANIIGLLALQGDFARHAASFAALGVETRLVRYESELDDCAGLVIPGGESTTLARLIDREGLRQRLLDFAAERAVMGTCAGLIMLAGELEDEVRGDHGVVPFGLLPCRVRRNGFGRQVDSFTEDLSIKGLDGSTDNFKGVYIRAPRILDVGDDCEVLATRGEEPVMIRRARVLGMSFHPELTDDTRIHAAFADMAARG